MKTCHITINLWLVISITIKYEMFCFLNSNGVCNLSMSMWVNAGIWMLLVYWHKQTLPSPMRQIQHLLYSSPTQIFINIYKPISHSKLRLYIWSCFPSFKGATTQHTQTTWFYKTSTLKDTYPLSLFSYQNRSPSRILLNWSAMIVLNRSPGPSPVVSARPPGQISMLSSLPSCRSLRLRIDC